MDIDGACVRVRWTLPEEDRHEVDRKAIEAIFAGAAQLKLEGRVIPVVRTRAAGISQASTVAAKVHSWAQATEANVAPLLACLEALQGATPEEIATRILASTDNGEESAQANDDGTVAIECTTRCQSESMALF